MNRPDRNRIEVETAANPVGCVIWLHGLGADGSDFEPIVPALGLPADLPVRFVFPNAPIRPVTINNGMMMPAWYDIYGLDGGQQDAAGIQQSQDSLKAMIADEQARGISANKVVLAGFSQGGAIALQTGLRYEQPLAGIMALSTYLPLADSLPAEKSQTNASVPILMVHGQQDAMISLPRAEQSRAHIERAGFQVDWHTFDMGHEVCMPEVQLIGQWLTEVLSR